MINIFMSKKFVFVECDVYCQGWTNPPSYRVYVNDELFTERTWIWPDHYLTEMLQISAPPGDYRVTVQAVGPQLAQFTVTNHRVEYGPAEWVKKNSRLRIHHAST